MWPLSSDVPAGRGVFFDYLLEWFGEAEIRDQEAAIPTVQFTWMAGQSHEQDLLTQLVHSLSTTGQGSYFVPEGRRENSPG
jgi:hypothetical protein